MTTKSQIIMNLLDDAIEYVKERWKDDPSDSEMAFIYGEKTAALKLARSLIYKEWPDCFDDAEEDV